MSNSIHIASNGYKPISVEPFVETRIGETEKGVVQSANQSLVSSSSDLRLAELRGDRYTISEEQLVKAIEQAIKQAEGRTTNLQFSIHETTKRIAVKVLDRSTGEVIREIPPEKTLDFVAKLWEMAGILVDEKR